MLARIISKFKQAFTDPHHYLLHGPEVLTFLWIQMLLYPWQSKGCFTVIGVTWIDLWGKYSTELSHD